MSQPLLAQFAPSSATTVLLILIAALGGALAVVVFVASVGWFASFFQRRVSLLELLCFLTVMAFISYCVGIVVRAPF